MAEYKLPFTAEQIEDKLTTMGKVYATAEYTDDEMNEVQTGQLTITSGDPSVILEDPSRLVILVSGTPCYYAGIIPDLGQTAALYQGKVILTTLPGVRMSFYVAVLSDMSYISYGAYESDAKASFVSSLTYMLSGYTVSDNQIRWSYGGVSQGQDAAGLYMLNKYFMRLKNGVLLPYSGENVDTKFYDNTTIKIVPETSEIVVTSESTLSNNDITKIVNMIGTDDDNIELGFLVYS